MVVSVAARARVDLGLVVEALAMGKAVDVATVATVPVHREVWVVPEVVDQVVAAVEPPRRHLPLLLSVAERLKW